LLYADIAEEQKHAIIDALGIQLPLTIRIEATELWADHPAGVPSWHRLARVPFPGLREDDLCGRGNRRGDGKER